MNSYQEMLRKGIQEKRKLLDDLYDRLDRSFAIQELWPNAFAIGPVTSYLAGSLHEPEKMYLVIENCEEKRKFEICKVPEVLFWNHLNKQRNRLPTTDRNLFDKLEKYYQKCKEGK